MGRKKIKLLYIIVFLITLACSEQAFANTTLLDRIVAYVEGVGVITDVQLIQYTAVNTILKSGYSKSIEELNNYSYMRSSLSRLIDRMLILRDAQLLSINKPKQQEINELIEEFKKKFHSPAEIETFMHKYAITDQYLKKFMSDKILVEHYLADEVWGLVRVSEKDVEQYYNNNLNAYKGMSKEEALREIKAFLEKQAYEKQLKSWIKTLTVNRQIIIMY